MKRLNEASKKMNVGRGMNEALSPGMLPHQDVGEQEANWQSALRGAITEAGGKPSLKCIKYERKIHWVKFFWWLNKLIEK